MEDIQPASQQSTKGHKRLKRSQVACIDCRRRKVRCDVAVNGLPCTNCRLDGCQCVITTKRRRLSIPMARTSQKEGAEVDKLVSIDFPDLLPTTSHQESLPDCDESVATTLPGSPPAHASAPAPAPAPAVQGSSQVADDVISESTLRSSTSIQSQVDQVSAATSNYAACRNSEVDTIESYMPSPFPTFLQQPVSSGKFLFIYD